MTRELATAAAILAGALGFNAPDPKTSPRTERTLAELRATHERLHQQLQDVVSKDPVVRRAFADKGQVVVAIQSKWIEQVLADVAVRYLDDVTLDLNSVEANAGGTVRTDTFVGKITLGDWHLDVKVVSLRGSLAADRPVLAFRNPDLLHVELPVRVRRSRGQVSLRLHWDSAALANMVCHDFDLARDLQGTVLAQTHTLAGDIAFRSVDGEITAAPEFPDRKVALRVDLSSESWAEVEAALRSQDSAGRCGALMKPERILEKLHELGQRGIPVTLPASIFNPVRLPGRVEKRVSVQDRDVAVTVSADTLVLSSQMLWSSASVHVAAQSSPAAASADASAPPRAQ